MTKSLIAITHLIILFFIGLFSDGPSFDINAPKNAKPGETFTVQVTIHKGDYKDFARFLQKLPEGFVAAEDESDGAKFLFENGEVKFIWYSTPSKKDLKISYKVTAPASASGDVQITGKYSYVDNGSSTAIQTEPLTIAFDGGTTATTTTTNTVTPVDTMAKPAVTVTSERTLPASAQGEFTVQLVINKGDLRSFAKVQDSLPAGFTATEIETDGSKFTFENGKVKFTWFDLPDHSPLKVSYKVTVSPDVSGAQTINGIFSYVEAEKGKISPIAASSISITAPAVATTTGTGDTGTTGTTGATGSTGDSGTTTAKTGNDSGTTGATGSTGDSGTSGTASASGSTGSSSTSTGSTGVTSVPSAQNGVNYRIQIAAMRRMVAVSEFSSRFGISEKIDAEMIDGLNKYLVGAFGAYQDARNKREDIRGKGVSDAFVTAYNNGKRITVQEALMITSQKWVR